MADKEEIEKTESTQDEDDLPEGVDLEQSEKDESEVEADSGSDEKSPTKKIDPQDTDVKDAEVIEAEAITIDTDESLNEDEENLQPSKKKSSKKKSSKKSSSPSKKTSQSSSMTSKGGPSKSKPANSSYLPESIHPAIEEVLIGKSKNFPWRTLFAIIIIIGLASLSYMNKDALASFGEQTLHKFTREGENPDEKAVSVKADKVLDINLTGAPSGIVVDGDKVIIDDPDEEDGEKEVAQFIETRSSELKEHLTFKSNEPDVITDTGVEISIDELETAEDADEAVKE